MKEATRSRVVVFVHVALVVLSVGLYRWAKHPRQADASPSEGRIQVALLLDTSGSMKGLLDQARSQLWKIVTRLDAARRAGTRPRLEIAVYEYGNPSGSSAWKGWVRQVLPFSSDLDRVSEALFALSTSGGDEFVGAVVRAASTELEWSGDARDLKLIFVAGNEPFTQGSVPPAVAIAQARSKGIVVNVIHCGGDDPTWRAGAVLAGTALMNIDQNQAVVHTPAPQDDEIASLGVALNATYLPYGDDGTRGMECQAAQDRNAADAQAGSGVWRSQAKASPSYRNAGWDLVDAVRDGKVTLDKVRPQDLPPAMRLMNDAQRAAHVQKLLAERTRLQERIRALVVERDAFVTARAEQPGKTADSLDSAMLAATQAQATAAGFRFE
jgi:hypothetical protein